MPDRLTTMQCIDKVNDYNNINNQFDQFGWGEDLNLNLESSSFYHESPGVGISQRMCFKSYKVGGKERKKKFFFFFLDHLFCSIKYGFRDLWPYVLFSCIGSFAKKNTIFDSWVNNKVICRVKVTAGWCSPCSVRRVVFKFIRRNIFTQLSYVSLWPLCEMFKIQI